ncbi:hypothetical protein Q8W71_31810 [Methylobacterium sp. NEAU 140]|uniref:hypothetical protein n=1 Tax=Methylobacterium sp. NEAU 140 TaxID=3064945 RepID=UPI0027356452|nr:hypothetical protein [Methylobacterium sp. NEAU 140]MDP4027167.1 hypothetical protein [Methylobacterium sp. NEAU 140]
MGNGSLVPLVTRKVQGAWNSLQTELKKLGGDVRPKSFADVFEYVPEDGGVLVRVRPVSFWLKEKAANRDCSLYVTVTGTMLFSDGCTDASMLAAGFGTQVGYFRARGADRLEHVFGIHYDHDDELMAHPVYHSQMSSMAGFVSEINASHHTRYGEIAEADDLVRGLLRNVRVPTAHMDVFSVFLQILGDHLVSDADETSPQKGHMGKAARANPETSKQSDAVTSKKEALAALERLRRSMSFCRSSPLAAARLNAAATSNCFRSYHWYAQSN